MPPWLFSLFPLWVFWGLLHFLMYRTLLFGWHLELRHLKQILWMKWAATEALHCLPSNTVLSQLKLPPSLTHYPRCTALVLQLWKCMIPKLSTSHTPAQPRAHIYCKPGAIGFYLWDRKYLGDGGKKICLCLRFEQRSFTNFCGSRERSPEWWRRDSCTNNSDNLCPVVIAVVTVVLVAHWQSIIKSTARSGKPYRKIAKHAQAEMLKKWSVEMKHNHVLRGFNNNVGED